jgi:RNA polymerase sigma-70 factor (ECF subfamily)
LKSNGLRETITVANRSVAASSNQVMQAIESWPRLRPRERALDDFREIVEEHSSPLFRLAYRITGNRQDAEDVVQETFIKVHRSRTGFDERAQMSSWLHRIATNVAIDLLRKRRRQRVDVQETLDDHGALAVDDPDPERRVWGGEINQRVRNALERLSTKEKAAFVLRHLEGMSIEEIGRVTKTGTNTTKNLIFRAVRKIRRELAPYVEVNG